MDNDTTADTEEREESEQEQEAGVRAGTRGRIPVRAHYRGVPGQRALTTTVHPNPSVDGGTDGDPTEASTSKGSGWVKWAIIGAVGLGVVLWLANRRKKELSAAIQNQGERIVGP